MKAAPVALLAIVAAIALNAPTSQADAALRIDGVGAVSVTPAALPVEDPALEGVALQALSIEGQPGSWGRLARLGDAASGVIVTERGTFWLASDPEGRIVAVPDADAVSRIPLSERIIEPEETAVGCDSLNWTPVFASPTRLASNEGSRNFTVAFAYDEQYKQRYPGVWQTTLASTIATIDELLFRDAGIHLQVFTDPQRNIGIELVPASVVADTTSETLARLQDHYVARFGGQVGETVFLFSGRDFTNAGGQVNCVGSAGRTTVSYGVASVAGGDYAYPGGLVLLPDPGVKIGAHELGHTLSAHHHYANCVEAATVYNPIHTTDACTILINDWGLIGLRYSSLERLSMMGWADAYDI